MRLGGAVFVALVCAAGGGCSRSTSSDPPAASGSSSAAFEAVQLVFEARCVKCHSDPKASDELVLTRGAARDALVGKPSRQVPGRMLVEPGHADRSYLVDKLLGTHKDVGGKGRQMPKGKPPLTEDEIAAVRRWVDSGAGP